MSGSQRFLTSTGLKGVFFLLNYYFMIRALVSLVIFFSPFISTFAQSPDLFSYQAVVRDNAGNVLASSSVSLRFSILQTTATGSAQYVETHNPTTDANGLVSLMIGGGTVSSGTFAAIDWANDKFFLKVELDPAGGSSYSSMGTTQLISVPYAKHAETAMRAINDSVKDADADSTNELQTLSISNDTIFLSNGGFAVIPDSSLLGVKKGGSGIGAGGSADLKDFDNNFQEVSRIGSGFKITSIEADLNNNLFVFGSFKSSMVIGGQTITGQNADGYNVFIAKFDSSLNMQWVKNSQSTNVVEQGYFDSFTIDGLGNSYLIFNVYGASFNWDGSSIPISTNKRTAFILKISATGSLVWNVEFKALNSSVPKRKHLTVNSSFDVFVTGAFSSVKVLNDSLIVSGYPNIRYGLFKIAANGQSAQLLDSAINVEGKGLAFDNSGNLLVLTSSNTSIARFTSSSITTSRNGLLLKYNSSNSIVSSNNDFDVNNRGNSNTAPTVLKVFGNEIFIGNSNYDFWIDSDFYSSGQTSYFIQLNSSMSLVNHSVTKVSGSAIFLGMMKKQNGELVKIFLVWW